MPLYTLDASFFVQAKNTHFGMDFCPAFWAWVDEMFAKGTFASCMAVQEELADGDDELAQWAEDKKNAGFFTEPSRDMQSLVGNIADHVVKNYPAHNAEKFLEKADPWVIAHAKIGKLIVVSNEAAVDSRSKKPKIPNICKVYSVESIDSVKLLRLLKPSFMSK